MKTYAFHSYKGGTGRTLALANFAIALRNSGNRVLMIDFDFDAPGLPYKFEAQSKVQSGYVHYLMAASPSERANGINRRVRIELIKESLVEVDNNIQLLPAGDPGRVAYWRHLASDEFHRLFLLHEDSKSLRGSRRKPETHENWQAFKRDLDDIAEAAGHPHYCLVDCRAAQETISVPLLAWAEHIIEFLHCNHEGVFGGLLILKLLANNELRASGFKFTPVVCRVPYGTAIEQIRSEVAVLSRACASSFFAGIELPMENLQILYEQRDIEVGDVVVLNEKDSSRFSLSYNYANLFDSLEPFMTEEEKKHARQALNLNQQDEIIEKYFRYYFSSGELLNKDNERNVALRKKTLVELINSLADDQDMTLEKKGVSKNEREFAIAAAFENAGFRAGQSFGLEAIDEPRVWEGGTRPETTLERLRQWCKFDRESGFGDWTAEYDSDKRKGEIKIANNFLAGTRGELGVSFITGYIRGVLGHLVGDVKTVANITIVSATSDKVEFKYE